MVLLWQHLQKEKHIHLRNLFLPFGFLLFMDEAKKRHSARDSSLPKNLSVQNNLHFLEFALPRSHFDWRKL
ncbi:MAG: hypothetical protein JWQ87_426 [Candidatus Sulfotelmatobacter sp.]|nr:hypothetical protein [Candidatus Sulfotelmatobacter sp.]